MSESKPPHFCERTSNTLSKVRQVIFDTEAPYTQPVRDDFYGTIGMAMGPGTPRTTIFNILTFLASALDRTVYTPRTKDVAPFILCVIFLSFSLFIERVSDETTPIYFTRQQLKTALGYDRFRDVSTISEYYEWLNNVVGPSLFSDVSGPFQSNIPCGNITLNQLRALPKQCEYNTSTVGSRRNITTCYERFDSSIPDVTEYRGFLSNKNKIANGEVNAPRYIKEIEGILRSYPLDFNSLFSEVFALKHHTAEQFTSKIEALKSRDWLDEATRVLTMDVITYNVNLQTFFLTRFTLEISEGGRFVHWSSMETFEVKSPWSGAEVLSTCVHGFLILYFVYDLWRLLQRMAFQYILFRRIIFLFSFWNCVNVLHSFFFWCALYARIRLIVFYNQFSNRIESSDQTLDEIIVEGGTFYDDCFVYLGLVVTVGWLRMVVYVDHIPKLCIVTMTMLAAMPYLVGLSLIMCVVVFAFGILGHLYYGFDMDEFRTMGTTTATLVKMLLGEFPSWSEMDRIRPGVQTTSFLFSFMFVGWTILLNLLLAVLTDAFYTCKALHEQGKSQYNISVLVDSVKYLENFIYVAWENVKVKFGKKTNDKLAVDEDNEGDDNAPIEFETTSNGHHLKKQGLQVVFGHMDPILMLRYTFRDSITSIIVFRRVTDVAYFLEGLVNNGFGQDMTSVQGLQDLVEKSYKPGAKSLSPKQWKLLEIFVRERYDRDNQKTKSSNQPHQAVKPTNVSSGNVSTNSAANPSFSFAESFIGLTVAPPPTPKKPPPNNPVYETPTSTKGSHLRLKTFRDIEMEQRHNASSNIGGDDEENDTNSVVDEETTIKALEMILQHLKSKKLETF